MVQANVERSSRDRPTGTAPTRGLIVAGRRHLAARPRADDMSMPRDRLRGKGARLRADDTKRGTRGLRLTRAFHPSETGRAANVSGFSRAGRANARSASAADRSWAAVNGRLSPETRAQSPIELDRRFNLRLSNRDALDVNANWQVLFARIVLYVGEYVLAQVDQAIQRVDRMTKLVL